MSRYEAEMCRKLYRILEMGHSTKDYKYYFALFQKEAFLADRTRKPDANEEDMVREFIELHKIKTAEMPANWDDALKLMEKDYSLLPDEEFRGIYRNRMMVMRGDLDTSEYYENKDRTSSPEQFTLPFD